ncbi:MAG: hypothetical protein IJK23_06930 [Clostridia bacterium]|nr:hypothetical protein [Clostridia bacterium]
MNNKIKYAVSLLLALILLVQIVPFAIAEDLETPADDPIIEEYVNISSVYCDCYISGITLYASATLNAKSSMSLSIKIEVQKLKSGEYSTIETWTASKTGVSLSLDDHRTINIFSTYRIKVTFTAGGESTTLYDYA